MPKKEELPELNLAHVDRLHIDPSKTREFEIPGIKNVDRTVPKFICLPGSRSNRAYFAKVLARSQQTASRAVSGGVTVDMVDDQLNDDRQFFSESVIVGWVDAKDANAQPIPFSPAHCQAYLSHVPDDLFQRFRDRVANDDSFRDYDEPTEGEQKAAAGN